MAVSIIRLTDETAKCLESIADDVFDGPVQPDFLNAFLSDARHVMFLAVEDALVVGMVSGVEYFHPDKPPQLWLNEVGVATSRRKQGIGRMLTEAMVQEAERRGCIYAWLGTAADNIAAQSCFASTKDVEPPQPFLLYEWDLED
jgi:ribosomal protein S18 acetylase RimI-like enzyme